MEKNVIRDGYLAGSYTVEAAFLVPLILGILFAWLFQLFYLHDKVVLNGMLEEMIIQREESVSDEVKEEQEFHWKTETGDGMEEEKGQKENWSQFDERERIQSHLWMMRIDSFQENRGITNTKYVLRSSATWNIPVMDIFLKNYFVCEVSEEINHIHPENWVRLNENEREGSKEEKSLKNIQSY